MRLVGWIPLGRRILWSQREQELAARRELAPSGNCRRIDFDGLGSNFMSGRAAGNGSRRNTRNGEKGAYKSTGDHSVNEIAGASPQTTARTDTEE